MADEGVIFRKSEARRVQNVVEWVEDRHPGLKAGQRQKQSAPPRLTLVVKLDGALAQATNFLTGAKTATASVYKGDGDVGGTWSDTGDNITVVNRDTTNDYASGDYGRADRILGEWIFSPMEC